MSLTSQGIFQQSVREQLLQAREILELGLRNVSYARSVVALTDGKSIADVGWVKVHTHGLSCITMKYLGGIIQRLTRCQTMQCLITIYSSSDQEHC